MKGQKLPPYGETTAPHSECCLVCAEVLLTCRAYHSIGSRSESGIGLAPEVLRRILCAGPISKRPS